MKEKIKSVVVNLLAGAVLASPLIYSFVVWTGKY